MKRRRQVMETLQTQNNQQQTNQEQQNLHIQNNQQNNLQQNSEKKYTLIEFSEDSKENFHVLKKLFKHFFSKILNSEEAGEYVATYFDQADEQGVYGFFLSLAFNLGKYRKSENIVRFPVYMEKEFKSSLASVVYSYYNGDICPNCIKKLSSYVFSDETCVIMLPCEDLKKRDFFLVVPFDNVENLILCFYRNKPQISDIFKEEPIILDEENYEIIVELLEEENEEE